METTDAGIGVLCLVRLFRNNVSPGPAERPAFDRNPVHDYSGRVWLLARPELRRVVYDRRDAGLEVEEDQALDFDGVMFANAVSQTSWAKGSFQVTICEECGVEGCARGGWLSLVRAGAYAVFIPMFESMLIEHCDAQPPRFGRGTPYIPLDAYQNLRNLLPQLPPAERVRPMSGSDALCLWQWETPFELLGRFQDKPNFRTDLVAAVDGPEGDVGTRILNVTSRLAHAEFAELRPAGATKTTVWLDMKGSPSVELLETHEGQDHALVSGLALVPIT